MQALTEIFEKLASEWSEYSARRGQIELAQGIESIIENGGIGLFEAGTGTGKTLSYLVPALLSSGQVVISTGTKNLQDQLFRKDLPLLQPWFPGKRIALLKGRTNYLCHRRLKMNIRLGRYGSKLEGQLQEVRSWSSRTTTGDLTELLDPEENQRLWPLVTSTTDNCLGGKCPDYNECPLYRARDKALESDIVIVNHHLLMSDLGRDEDHARSLLPAASAIIVDEAHQLPGVARQFFGQRLGSGHFHNLIRDIRDELAMLGNDDPASLDAVKRFEKESDSLGRHVNGDSEQEFDLWLNEDARAAIFSMDDALAQLGSQLLSVAGRSEGLAHCARRVLAMADIFTLLTEQAEPDGNYVHWLESSGKGYTIHLSPLSTGRELCRTITGTGSSWVFTSATLSVGENFDHFIQELGVTDTVSEIFPSPFDYESSVRACIPTHLPEPGTEAHTRSLIDYCLPLIRENDGKTFFLFTSHRAMQLAAAELEAEGLPIVTQGSMSKMQVMSVFLSTPRCVLLGTQSFWEGVDVRGAGLKMLIIDKLPFPNPGDPVYRAQAELVSGKGGNGFIELALPRAVLSLKQGFGRLMREEDDRGLFVLGDSRVHHRSYRGYVLENLPTMHWLGSAEEARCWLAEI